MKNYLPINENYKNTVFKLHLELDNLKCLNDKEINI